MVKVSAFITFFGLLGLQACKPRVDSALSDIDEIVQTEQHRIVTELKRVHESRIGSISHADFVNTHGHGTIVSADDAGKVVVTDTRNNEVKFETIVNGAQGSEALDTAVSRSLRYVAVSYRGKGVYIYDIKNKNLLKELPASSDLVPGKLAFIGTIRKTSYLAITQVNKSSIKIYDLRGNRFVGEVSSRQYSGSQGYKDVFSLNYFGMFGAIIDDRIEFWSYNRDTLRCYSHVGVEKVSNGKAIFGIKKCTEEFPRTNSVFGHLTSIAVKKGQKLSSAGFGGSVPQYMVAVGTDNGYLFVIDDVVAEAGKFEIVDDKRKTGMNMPVLKVTEGDAFKSPEYALPIGVTTMFAPNKNTFKDSYKRGSGSIRCKNLRNTSTDNLDDRADFQAITSLDFGRFSRGDSPLVGNWRDSYSLVATSKDGAIKIVSIGNLETRMRLAYKRVKFQPGNTSYIVVHRDDGVTLGVVHRLFLGQNTLIKDAVFVSRSEILVGTGTGRRFVWHSNSTEIPIPIGRHMPAGRITYLNVSLDGHYVAAADVNKNIAIWRVSADTTESEPTSEVFGQQSSNQANPQGAVAKRDTKGVVNSLQFSKDGGRVLYVDGGTHIWKWQESKNDSSQQTEPRTNPQESQARTSESSEGKQDSLAGNPSSVTGFTQGNGVMSIAGTNHRVATWNHEESLIIVGTDDGQLIRFNSSTGDAVGNALSFSQSPIVSIALHTTPTCNACVAVMDEKGAIGFGSLEDAQHSVFQMPGALEDNNTVTSTSYSGGLGRNNGLEYFQDGTAFFVAVNFEGSRKKNYVAVQPDYLFSNNNIRGNSSGKVEQETFAHKSDPIIGIHSFKVKADAKRGEGNSGFMYVATPNEVEVWDPLTCQLVRKLDLKDVGRISISGSTNRNDFLITGSDRGRLDVWHIENEFELSDLINDE